MCARTKRRGRSWARRGCARVPLAVRDRVDRVPVAFLPLERAARREEALDEGVVVVARDGRREAALAARLPVGAVRVRDGRVDAAEDVPPEPVVDAERRRVQRYSLRAH